MRCLMPDDSKPVASVSERSSRTKPHSRDATDFIIVWASDSARSVSSPLCFHKATSRRTPIRAACVVATALKKTSHDAEKVSRRTAHSLISEHDMSCAKVVRFEFERVIAPRTVAAWLAIEVSVAFSK